MVRYSDELIDEMKNFDLIMAREPLTYNALLKYVDKKRLMLVPDPAFSLKMNPQGSIISNSRLRQAPNRKRVPVFCGISG